MAGCLLDLSIHPAVLGVPRGRWIIKTAKHVSAVVKGTIHDTFRQDPFRRVYGARQLTLEQNQP